MSYQNNIYGNAVYVGSYAASLAGRSFKSATATDYLGQKTAALAIAVAVDALIAFDALVTTGSAITQLAITTNTIAANEQWRAGLLQAIAYAASDGRAPSSGQAASSVTANAIFAAWTEGLLGLVTP